MEAYKIDAFRDIASHSDIPARHTDAAGGGIAPVWRAVAVAVAAMGTEDARIAKKRTRKMSR